MKTYDLHVYIYSEKYTYNQKRMNPNVQKLLQKILRTWLIQICDLKIKQIFDPYQLPFFSLKYYLSVHLSKNIINTYLLF